MSNRLTAEEVFHAVREKSDPAERASILDGACGDDARLRAKVEALLKADAAAGKFLTDGTPGSGLNATIPQAGGARRLKSGAPAPEHPSEMIGRYKLLARTP